MKDPKDHTGSKLHNRRLVCENSRFEVFLDHVEDKTGFAISDYLVVSPRRKAANMVTGVAILPIVDGKYVLLRIYRHAINGYSWEAPRGFVETGEENIESVARELEEETGLGCAKDNIRSMGYVTPDAGVLSARMHLFVATQCQWRAPFEAKEMGHRELRLFDDSEIVQMVRESVIQDPCTLVAYYRYAIDLRKGMEKKDSSAR